ncbi:hypothetical protein GALMADRAFT_257032 [Galerina marginata CBS 339.88]|uniref:Protein kinase domain-containing protein n=1 Tax=Galerina marginata (strain CBS 339.88) TaxID=685588 RepID=A0A067SBX7_GALM3|nr:hypothetical protein GALMADRAFT_257032 [Galerina marginata CBS 339.88]
MVTPLRKRLASRSPDGGRYAKRLATSSPEEGEVDDTAPAVLHPTIFPISLPAKPATLGQKKVPFPFKKKAEPSKDGAGGDAAESQEGPLNVFDRFEEEAKRREEPRRQRPRPIGKNAADHWEPGFGREKSLLSRMEPLAGGSHYHPSRDSTYNRDRDRRGSPISRLSPRRARSPHSPSTSYHREKHRLPAPRSPGNFSPPSQFGSDKIRDQSRERGFDRDRERDRDRHGARDEDSRRYGRRNSITDDAGGRHYRPQQNDYRRGDNRDWTRRDVPYQPDRRSSNRPDDRHDYERRHDSSRWDGHRHSRPASPEPSIPPGPVSPPPSLPPPQSLPPIKTPQSPLPPPALPLPPPPPPTDTAPRPPSSSPPPAPPPDTRLNKDSILPPIHAQVKITLKRPDAPPNLHSPVALDLPPVSTAQAMAHGAELRSDKPQFQPPKERPEVKEPVKEPERPKLQMFRRKLPARRTQKAELMAYGHGFVGCGQKSDYEATTKLGEGTFGEVHKAIHKSTSTVVALKRILMHNEKEGMPVTALREIKILKALKHSCIVDILDMFIVRSTEKDPLSVYMVFPYMDHDLAGLLENERVKLQPSHIKLYMKQLLEGTEYMHRNHILHRDMKAANLLISNDGSLKIADFGLARTFDSGVATARGDGTQRGRERKYTNCVVTRWYRPPELLLGARHYGGEVDMWGIGCVLGEMFTRKPILPGSSDLDQLEKIWLLCGTPNQHSWPNFDQLPGCEGVIRFNSHHRRLKQTYDSIGLPTETVDLLDKLLIVNPRDRLTAAEALVHDYFWTDPLPADPRTMPSYEASHEFDKRGHRNHPPMPAMPPAQMHHGNQYRHPPPPGNQQFNRGGQRGGPPQHGHGPDSNRRGPGPGPGQGPPQFPPPPSHGLPNPPHLHPPAFRGGPSHHQHGPPPHGGPHPHGQPPLHGQSHLSHGQTYPPVPPPPPPGQPINGPPHNYYPPYNNNHGGHPPPGQHSRPPYGSMPGGRGGHQGPRNDRRGESSRNMPSSAPASGPRLPPNPNLPARPTAPLGVQVGGRDNDRERHSRSGPTDRRGDLPAPPMPGESADGPPAAGLNYG